MHACLLLFRTMSTYQVVCLRLVTAPFPITISSHIHVFHPLQASSTANSRTSWGLRYSCSRGAVKPKIHF